MILGIYDQMDNDTIEKYCYDDLESNCTLYGGLYQWDEMMQYVADEGTVGICPVGWHVPSDNELKILEGTVDSQFDVGDPVWNLEGYRGYDAAKNLKSTYGWYNNGNGLDTYSFEALPSGIRNAIPAFNLITKIFYYWSSTEINETYVWTRHFKWESDQITRYDIVKIHGRSVRCLKD
jgi:uncharacterized protein (TIGR02145 family)